MNFTSLSTVTEVDALLKLMNEKKDDLLFRTSVLNREKKGMSTTVTDIDAELVKVNARLTASNAILAVITDPEDLKDETLKRDRLEVRKRGLENRKDDSNVIALAMLEFELDEIAVRITEIDLWVTNLNNRKAEIVAA